MAFSQDQLDEFKRRYEQDFPNVDESLMQALIKQESGGNPNAVSPKGASGATQIMPNTWPEISKDLGYSYSFDDLKQSPELQRLGGKAYLAKQLKMFNNNIPASLAAYNWGPANVQQHLQKNPNALANLADSGMPDETKNYVSSILSNYEGFPKMGDAQDALQKYKAMLAQSQDTRNPVEKMVSPEPTSQKVSNLDRISKIKGLLAGLEKQRMVPNQGVDAQVNQRLDADAYKKELANLQDDPYTKFNPEVDPQSQSILAKLGLDDIVNKSIPENKRMKLVKQPDQNEYYSAPDDSFRSDTDLLSDMIKNKSPNPVAGDGQPVDVLQKDTSTADKIKSLIGALLAAQANQTRTSGMLGLVKSAGDIADAFAAGRGANTTKLGNSGTDFAEKQLGEPVQQLQDQLKMRKEELGLQNAEEAANPNSQLSKMQTDFVKKMAGDLGMDVSSIKAMGAKNATELMQSLAYLSKIKGEQENRKILLMDKYKKDHKLSDKQAKDVTDFDTSISNVDQIIDMLGRNSNYTGSFDGRVPDMLVGADQVAWRTALGQLNDQYRRLITGAAAGDKELKMLASRLPQATDTYQNFLAKAQMFRQIANNARNTYVKNLSRQGKDTSEYDVPAVSVDEGFSPKSKGQEAANKNSEIEMAKQYLANPNIRDDIKNQIKQKYGL